MAAPGPSRQSKRRSTKEETKERPKTAASGVGTSSSHSRSNRAGPSRRAAERTPGLPQDARGAKGAGSAIPPFSAIDLASSPNHYCFANLARSQAGARAAPGARAAARPTAAKERSSGVALLDALRSELKGRRRRALPTSSAHAPIHHHCHGHAFALANQRSPICLKRRSVSLRSDIPAAAVLKTPVAVEGFEQVFLERMD